MTDQGPRASFLSFFLRHKSGIFPQEVSCKPEQSTATNTGSQPRQRHGGKSRRTCSACLRAARMGSSANDFGACHAVAIKNTGTNHRLLCQGESGRQYVQRQWVLPKTLAPRTSFTVTIMFATTVAETSTGCVQIGSNATNRLVDYAISGTGVRL
jgi:hypothetical protein